jgi:hypothetical protein
MSACAASTTTAAARTVCQRAAPKAAAPASRAAFFTGAQLRPAAAAPRAAARAAVQTRTLFGGGSATAGKSIYDFKAKVRRAGECSGGGTLGEKALGTPAALEGGSCLWRFCRLGTRLSDAC